MMKLDAISVTSGNIARATQFYGLLGFSFAEFGADEKHVEAITADGEVRLMIDDRELMKSIIGAEPRPSNHSAFAIKCASPHEVGAAAARIRDAGHAVVKAPWDAFWGQRYAVVADPDGYRVDLFASP